VADGILRSDGYRYLILPYAQALSASESKEIDAFVKEGGYVIADLRPGVRDEHGKALPQGSLDHVFGVRQTTGKPDVRKGGVKLMAEGFPADLPETCADASLCLTTGTARGEVNKAPAMIVNTYGKGRAILLNFSLSGYARVEGGLENSSVAGGKDAIPIGTFWKSLKAHVGMPEKVRIAAQNPSGLRIYRYGYGSLVYMGVLQDLPEAEIQYALQKAKPLEAAPVELTLDGKVHVYDTRAGKYLGYTDKISITVKPGIAHLYSFLPYGVKAISVKMPGSVQRGQNLNYKISISAKGGDVGRHVIRRTLVAPDGGEVTYYSENQVAEKGKLEGGIPLAFNERQGKWKIKFKDIASGVEATKTFIVEDAK